MKTETVRNIPKVFILCAVFISLSLNLSAQEDPEKDNVRDPLEERRLVLLYGIEEEVIPVLEELVKNGEELFLDEVNTLFHESTSTNLRKLCIDYFTALESDAGTEISLEILTDYQDYNDALVQSAVTYLTTLEEKEAYPLLQNIVAGEDSGGIVRAAVRGLTESGDEAYSDLLIERFQDEDTSLDLKSEIVLHIGKLKKSSVESFLIGLAGNRDEENQLRQYACAALGDLGNPESFDTLYSVLSEDDPYLRQYALYGIGKLDHPETDDLLIQGLRDNFWRIRVDACRALGERNVGEAVPILVYKSEKDPVSNVRIAAIQALGKLSGSDSFDALTEMVKNSRMALKQRSAAVEALIDHGTVKSLPVLKEIMNQEWEKKDSPILDTICRQLADTEASGLGDIYRMMLGHGDLKIQIYGIWGIRKNRLSRFRPELEKLKEESSVQAVKNNVTLALEALKADDQ